MSHTYLLDTYKFLQERLDALQSQLTDSDADQQTKLYTAGQIESVCAIERFLMENYDVKLPRRLRGRNRSMGEIPKGQ